MSIKIERTKVVAAFESYTAKYNAQDPKIQLKILHTYRVASLCERIAESLSLSKEECTLAWLCGMLHDVGRFEQIRRYGTFSDEIRWTMPSLGQTFYFRRIC